MGATDCIALVSSKEYKWYARYSEIQTKSSSVVIMGGHINNHRAGKDLEVVAPREQLLSHYVAHFSAPASGRVMLPDVPG